jgi:hypothetical protein
VRPGEVYTRAGIWYLKVVIQPERKEEEAAEREGDKLYWSPLRRELEVLRQAKSGIRAA